MTGERPGAEDDVHESVAFGDSDENGGDNERDDGETGFSFGEAENVASEPTDDADIPLSGLADRVRDREPDAEFDDLFERKDTTDVDREELWEQVEGSDDLFEDLTVEREVREIPKVKYCRQCEHFSAPPEVACENEGTEIVELVDLETFRVIDCPVVLNDERLDRNR